MNLTELKAAVALMEKLQITQSDQPTSAEIIGAIGRKVIVRSRDAGVIYGEYAGNDGSTVHLKNARQLWKWFALKGISLMDVAIYGVNKPECKFSTAQSTITVFNSCAMIDVTAASSESIEAV